MAEVRPEPVAGCADGADHAGGAAARPGGSGATERRLVEIEPAADDCSAAEPGGHVPVATDFAGAVPPATDPGGAAQSTRSPGAVRVRVHPSTHLEGDEDATIEPGGGDDGSVRWVDAGHAVVGVGPASRRALVGQLGPIHPNGRQDREVVVNGWRFVLELEPERLARLRETAGRARGAVGLGGPAEIRAVIPGRVVAVSVAVGDSVEAGQQLLVIEAMKMQNEVRSPRAGVVARVAVAPGETVDLGAVLVGIA